MDNNELIGKYLFNQMTPSEQKEFEERLKTDKYLAEEVDLNKKIIVGIRQFAEEEQLINSFKEQYDKEKQQNLSRRLVFIRIAAIALLLIGTTWLLLFFFGQKKLSGDQYVSKEGTKVQTPVSQHSKDSMSKNLVAENKEQENFQELIRFEALIKQEYRSGDVVEVTSPKIDIKYNRGDTIVFQWQVKGINQLHLVIFNNKGKVISEQDIPVFYSYNKALMPGLYYWQLETDDEAVYIGKFVVQ